jgi:intracellular sulfur oxidation DsrE/DsrF family protein
VSREPVIVYYVRSGVSTHHLEEDTRKVHAALAAVDIGSAPVKELTKWDDKRRMKYLAELQKRGLEVMVCDNRRRTTR